MTETNMYDRLDEAQSKVIMLRESCGVFFRSDHAPDINWFHGAMLNCNEIIEAIEDVLEFNGDCLKKEASEGSASETPEA